MYPELEAIEENGKGEKDENNLDCFDLPDQDSKKLKAVEDWRTMQCSDGLLIPLVRSMANGRCPVVGSC